MMQIILAIGMLVFPLCGWTVEFFSWNTYQANQMAIQQLEKKNPDMALQNLNRGLEISPFDPTLHFNLGLTFEFLKKPESALSIYRQAEGFAQNTQKDHLFAIYFNQARILGEQKKIEEALSLYQKALRFRPESVEVKTNIELLLQQQQQQQQQSQSDSQKQSSQQQSSQDQPNKEEPKKESTPPSASPPEPQQSPKYKPRPFQGETLNEQDVRKILGELRQQEQKIRTEFNKKQNIKERPNEKDW